MVRKENFPFRCEIRSSLPFQRKGKFSFAIDQGGLRLVLAVFFQLRNVVGVQKQLDLFAEQPELAS